MRQTRINVFFMSAYSTYCNECLQYNELDKQKSFAPIIPAKKIVDEFETIMRKIGYKKEHNKGWMPFWHLSGDNIWNLYSINHQIVKKTAFKLLKPKTKKQLLSKVN